MNYDELVTKSKINDKKIFDDEDTICLINLN